MTRAKLLAFLHRLEPAPAAPAAPAASGKGTGTQAQAQAQAQGGGITAREQQDLVGAMLALEDVRGDAITDCLRVLLEYEVPPRLFMRTSIISSQKHSDVRTFVLSVVVPTLVRRKLWSQPVLWQGVCHAVKLLAEHKNAEPSLRAILGLPGPQLKEMVAVARKPLRKFLPLLSAREREEVVSGKWAGLEAENRGKGGEKQKTELLLELEKA